MMRGFSLIEVMVAMVIASIGVLALAKGTVTSLDSETIAAERIAATNLALDVIEAWQASASDAVPALECVGGTVHLTTLGSNSCQMITKEVKTTFTITVNGYPIQAPQVVFTSNNGTNGTNGTITKSVANRDLYSGLRISALLVDRNNANTLYAGTYGDGLFTSSDAGQNWSKIKDTGFTKINALVQMPGNGSVIVAGTDHYVMANTYYGGTWQQLPGTGSASLPSDANILSLAADAYGKIFAGVDNYTSISNYGGVYASSDTGQTWTPALVGSGPTDTYTVRALAVDSYVYAGTSVGVQVSTDSGSNWKLMDCQPGWTTTGGACTPSGYPDVGALAVDGSVLYAGFTSSSDAVEKTQDIYATLSWTNQGIPGVSGVTVNALDVAPNTTIIAGTKKNGVYIDGQQEVTGINVATNLQTYSVAALNGSTVYAGTENGLFKATKISSGGSSSWSWVRSDKGIGLIPQEKAVSVSWIHKGTTYSVVLTHITEKPY